MMIAETIQIIIGVLSLIATVAVSIVVLKYENCNSYGYFNTRYQCGLICKRKNNLCICKDLGLTFFAKYAIIGTGEKNENELQWFMETFNR